MKHGIFYSGFPAVLKGYSDATWISDSEESKFTSGYIFILGGGSISWRSAKQTILTKSSRDSEMIAMELAGTEAEWLKNFLASIPLDDKPTPSTSLHCDNKATIATAKNKTFKGKNRHSIETQNYKAAAERRCNLNRLCEVRNEPSRSVNKALGEETNH